MGGNHIINFGPTLCGGDGRKVGVIAALHFGREWHLADMPAALIDVRYRG
jgi:hypothetical protein